MLIVCPITRDAAFEFIRKHHRHHRKPVQRILQVAVRDGEEVRGVAVVESPKARRSNDGLTAEVTRCCTDGAKNACSMLYGACWRAVRALGYRRLITYTLPHEGGASLRGAGWTLVRQTPGGSWSRAGRLREDNHPTCAKSCWGVML